MNETVTGAEVVIYDSKGSKDFGPFELTVDEARQLEPGPDFVGRLQGALREGRDDRIQWPDPRLPIPQPERLAAARGAAEKRRLRRLKAWSIFAGIVTAGSMPVTAELITGSRAPFGVPTGWLLFAIAAVCLLGRAVLRMRIKGRTAARPAPRRDYGNPRCVLALALAALATALWAPLVGLGIDPGTRNYVAAVAAVVAVIFGVVGLRGSITASRTRSGR